MFVVSEIRISDPSKLRNRIGDEKIISLIREIHDLIRTTLRNPRKNQILENIAANSGADSIEKQLVVNVPSTSGFIKPAENSTEVNSIQLLYNSLMAVVGLEPTRSLRNNGF
jgi:hypothetical protein